MLSLILLSYFSGERITKAYENITELLSQEKIDFELIIIDDGSTDNSFEIAKQLESLNENVKSFQLSRNYTTNYAIFAGLSVCNGDCAMPIPDDEQQPYSTIVSMYRLWERGAKVIIPNRQSRNDGFLSDLFSKTYYKIINNLSDINFPPGGADMFFYLYLIHNLRCRRYAVCIERCIVRNESIQTRITQRAHVVADDTINR